MAASASKSEGPTGRVTGSGAVEDGAGSGVDAGAGVSAGSSVEHPTDSRTAASSAGSRPRAITSVEVVAQDLRAARVAQLGHGLGLDLADPLARHAVDLADLVERLGLAVGEAEAHRHHARLALGERV